MARMYEGASIAWTGKSVVIASTYDNADVCYFFQSVGASQWPREIVAAAGSTAPGVWANYQNPAIAWTGTSVVIAGTDSNGNLNFWWQPAGSTGWPAPQQVAGAPAGGVSYLNPAIAWTGSSVVITAADTNGNLYYWWQAAGATSWHRQPVVPDPEVRYVNPAIAWTGGSVVITATDGDGFLYYWWQKADTTTWHPETVAAGSTDVRYQNPAIAWTGTSVVITAADSNGNLNFWWQAADTGTWHPRQQVATSSEGFSFSDQNPAIALAGGTVVIAVTSGSAEGVLYYWWQPIGSGRWNGQQVAPILIDLSLPRPSDLHLALAVRDDSRQTRAMSGRAAGSFITALANPEFHPEYAAFSPGTNTLAVGSINSQDPGQRSGCVVVG